MYTCVYIYAVYRSTLIDQRRASKSMGLQMVVQSECCGLDSDNLVEQKIPVSSEASLELLIHVCSEVRCILSFLRKIKMISCNLSF